MPYATRPGRLLAQLFSDVAIAVWTAIWVFVGTAVYDAISTIAEAGRQVESGTNGIAGNLASAGHGAQHIPVVGDAVSKPLTSASQAASDIAAAVHEPGYHGGLAGGLLALAVVAPPILLGDHAVAVSAAAVLPAQMDGDRPGRHPGRSSNCWHCGR